MSGPVYRGVGAVSDEHGANYALLVALVRTIERKPELVEGGVGLAPYAELVVSSV